MGIVPPYVELHCHSAYSFLDGVSLPDELAARAHELGYEALALTDHNSVSGSMELALSAEQYGLRAIHGAEIDLTTASGRGVPDPDCGEPGRHITLLVENDSGWRNLCRIITLAHAGTRDGARRRDPAEPAVQLEAGAADPPGPGRPAGGGARPPPRPGGPGGGGGPRPAGGLR